MKKMRKTDDKTFENPGKMILPSIVISRFATMPPGFLVGLLLIDIGDSFGKTVGVTGQISTASSIIGVLSALLISVLSLSFNPKSLLVGGLVVLVVSAVGCAFAPNFYLLLTIYAMTGMAGSFVGPMAFTLIAEHFPQNQRANAISWVITGMSAANLIGAPIIGYISSFVGWRGSFLWFFMPISMLGLFMSVRFIPSKRPSNSEDYEDNFSIINSFKEVLMNTSAVSCLAGTALITAAYMAMVSYAPSFYREQFQFSTTYATFVIIGSSIFFILGTRICGRLVTLFGRKPLILWFSIGASISILVYLNVPFIWLSLAARFIGSSFSAIVFTATNALTLEQIPKYRGTVMSLNQATFNLGGVLGTGLGGLIILLSGYEAMGVSHGVMMLLAMLILHFFSKES
jgi:predicted MFS family arabinose efflux permease